MKARERERERDSKRQERAKMNFRERKGVILGVYSCIVIDVRSLAFRSLHEMV